MSNGNEPERVEKSSEIPPTNNLLAAIVAIIFLVVLGYFAFTYITGDEGESIYETISEQISTVFSGDTGDIISGSTERDGDESAFETGDDSMDGDMDVSEDTADNRESSTTVDDSVPTYDDGSTIIQWTANDYQPGDIDAGTYTVKDGDTLWEISEAVYGNGADWVNILNANAENVDTLPGGQQALIYAGQTLVIPQMN